MQIETNTDVMSAIEKRILRSIIDESDILPYPTRPLAMSVGPDAQEYIIPKRDKAKVLGELYPFYPVPAINDTMLCLHEGKNFKVARFKVIREDNRNYLVSPHYAHSGGMVIDWVEPDEKADA
jgi:hypothetical protein